MKDLFCCFFGKEKKKDESKVRLLTPQIDDGCSLKPPKKSEGYVIFNRIAGGGNSNKWIIFRRVFELMVPYGPHYNIVIDEKDPYYSNGNIMIPPHVLTYKCKIICTEHGEAGNTDSNTITLFSGSSFGYSAWDSFTNPEPVTGGWDGDRYPDMMPLYPPRR